MNPLLQTNLLGEVLLHLPPEDLLFCSEVSKLWNRVAGDNALWKPICLSQRIHEPVKDSWKAAFVIHRTLTQGAWTCSSLMKRNCLRPRLDLFATVHQDRYVDFDSQSETISIKKWDNNLIEVASFKVPNNLVNCFKTCSSGFSGFLTHNQNHTIFYGYAEGSSETEYYIWDNHQNELINQSSCANTIHLRNESTVLFFSDKLNYFFYMDLLEPDPKFLVLQAPTNYSYCMHYRDSKFIFFHLSRPLLFSVWDAKQNAILYTEESQKSAVYLTNAIVRDDHLIFLCKDDNKTQLCVWNLEKGLNYTEFEVDLSKTASLVFGLEAKMSLNLFLLVTANHVLFYNKLGDLIRSVPHAYHSIYSDGFSFYRNKIFFIGRDQNDTVYHSVFEFTLPGRCSKPPRAER